MIQKPHTVVETPQFISSLEAANVSEIELQSLISTLAADPMAGQVMHVRWGAWMYRYKSRAAGQSRRYRIVTFCAGRHMPLFLIDLFAEGEKLSFSQSEREQLGLRLHDVAAAYGRKPQ